MKAIAMALVLLCAGCGDEGAIIRDCSKACALGGVRMVKYSSTDGCICATPANAEVPK